LKRICTPYRKCGDKMRVIEKKTLPAETPYLISGLPDVGLVGAIATYHLITEMKMEEVAYFDSDMLPPIIVLHGGEPKMPIRIYGRDSFYVVTSEIALPSEPLVKMLARAVVDYAVEKNVKMIISVGGLATPNRMEIKEPKVYGVAVREEGKALLKKAGVDLLNEGYVVGIYAWILKECTQRRIPSVLLLAQSHRGYPDPGAAASALRVLGKMLDIEISVEQLLKEEERVRLKLRELMRRTNMMLERVQKGHELEIPPMMYV